MGITPKRILVLCTANRCRSQMAQGWLRHFGGQRVEVFSAGTRPSAVHPLAIQVMAEAGVDISGHTSKHLDRYLNEPFDVVVTVCDSARESCPVFPRASRMVHQSFADPDQPGLSPEALRSLFERTRDQVRAWAERFVREIT